MEKVDLIWRQAFGGGSQVLRPNIPVAEALTVLRDEALRAQRGEYGMGVVVYLQPAGEHDRHARLTSFLDVAATGDDAQLGRVVREVWMAWAHEQPDVATRPDWLDPWDQLPERIKDVDTRIGRTLFALGCAASVDKE